MITDEKLIDQYRELHKSSKYGQTARSAFATLKLCRDEVNPSSVIEYGCGQSELYKVLGKPGMVFDRYDPAVPGLEMVPGGSYDFLINTDVLEHIPEKDLDAVIGHFKELSDYAYIRISTRLARTILPNGENAHCTVWPGEKWLAYIRKFYPDAEMPYEQVGETCLILSWKSGMGERIAAIEAKRAGRKSSPVRTILKGLEKVVKRIRNAFRGRR
jgi:hypothetical protein